MDNLRSAFGWSIETGGIGRALELASSLMPLWLSRGRIQEGIAWFDAVLVAGNARLDELAPDVRRGHTPTRPCSMPGSTTTARCTPTKPSRSRANSTIRRCWPGHSPPAAASPSTTPRWPRDISPRRSAWLERWGDQWRLSQILGQQAHCALVTGNPVALRASAEEGRDVADAIGDRFGSRQCGWRLATALAIQCDLPGGSPCCAG